MRRSIPGGEAVDGGIADRPRVPVVDEDAALAARTARRDDVELVEQVGVVVETVNVSFAEVEGEAAVGDDGVEVVHEI